MKRSVKMLMLSAVLLALLGSYELVNRLNRQRQVFEETGAFAMTDRSADELVGLNWTNEDTQYHFQKNEDIWTNANDAAFPTNQEAVQQLAGRIMNFTATRKLENVETLADYGFTEDSFSVTAEWSDGETTRYILGDETPFADGWYTHIDGEDGVVYTTESALSAMFSETEVDLAQLEEIGSVETAKSLSIGNELKLVYRAESISLNADQHWYSETGEPMEDAAVEEVIGQIRTLEWQNLICVSADENALAQYQLNTGSAIAISVQGDDDDSIDLRIGSLNDDGEYYARLPDSNMVYTLDGESVEAILNMDMDALWNGAIFDLEYADVQQFSCALDGREYLFTPEVSGEETAEVELKDDAASGEATEAYEDSMEAIWAQIHALYAAERSEAEPSDEALLEISVLSRTGAQLKCSVYGYDVDSYLLATDEGRRLLVSADDVDKLIRMLRS